MNPKYTDTLVEISERDIVFHNYYFPFGAAKTVPLKHIAGIEVRPPSLRHGSWRIWGTGGFGIWFPLDWKRPKRDAVFVALLKDAPKRIGFTVEHSQMVTGILKEMGLLNDSLP